MPSVFCIVDDKHVPLFRVIWVSAVPHFCGEDDCLCEGRYEIRLEQGESIWGSQEDRDWVIAAFNQGMSFDDFTIKQLAGDLLPDPTVDDLIATAFHRNTLTNSEGGTNDEEFRNVAVVDRVNTTMEVWMGTTMACAQCHTHKFDPITQAEYFQFFDFFNQTADTDRTDECPIVELFDDPEQKVRKSEFKAQIAELEELLEEDPNDQLLRDDLTHQRYIRGIFARANPD